MGKNTSKLKPHVLDDLRAQTDFTDDEIHKWFRGFMKDVPNGKLTLDEFQEVYSQIFPLGNAKELSRHAFKVFDTNGDGAIDFREFLCALHLSSRGDLDQRLNWAFKMYDIDGDGFITKKEMHEIVTALHKMLHPDAPRDVKCSDDKTENVFRLMDANKDGKISLEEFIEGAKKDSSIMEVLSLPGTAI